jgi:hypothetical protein
MTPGLHQQGSSGWSYGSAAQDTPLNLPALPERLPSKFQPQEARPEGSRRRQQEQRRE